MTVTAPSADRASRAPREVEITYVPAPEGAPTDAPRIFTALNAAMRDITPVGKNQENAQQRYMFRGVDDVMSAVAGPFRAHGLFILPQMVDRIAERRGEKMTSVTVTMRYHVYGPGGDCLIATVPGEAADFADKATNKAQSAAMKYLLVHLFMIPVDAKSVDDGDRDHPVEPPAEHRAERQQRRQQQRGQRQQQPRRSNRAEAGQWETPPPQQAPPPRRDYLAEAQKASTPDSFAKVRAAAVAAGAPEDYLARLDAVHAQKRAAAQQRAVSEQSQQSAATAPPPGADSRPGTGPISNVPRNAMQWTNGQQPAPADEEDQERAAAVGEMYDAAKAAGLANKAEADETFAARYQCAPAAASLDQLREMRDDLLDAARGAAA